MNYLVEGSNRKERKLKIISLQGEDAKILFEEQTTIGIDNIRQLGREIALKQTKPQALILDRAERLTVPAQNSFLKLLEEPPPHISFILGVTHRNNLLPTIVSRCALVKTGHKIQVRETEQSRAMVKLFLTAVSQGIPAAINYKNKIKTELRDEEKAKQYFKVWIGVLKDSLLLKLGLEGLIFKTMAAEIEGTFSDIALADIKKIIESGNKCYSRVKENRVGKDRIAGSFLSQTAYLCTQKNN